VHNNKRLLHGGCSHIRGSSISYMRTKMVDVMWISIFIVGCQLLILLFWYVSTWHNMHTSMFIIPLKPEMMRMRSWKSTRNHNDTTVAEGSFTSLSLSSHLTSFHLNCECAAKWPSLPWLLHNQHEAGCTCLSDWSQPWQTKSHHSELSSYEMKKERCDWS